MSKVISLDSKKRVIFMAHPRNTRPVEYSDQANGGPSVCRYLKCPGLHNGYVTLYSSEWFREPFQSFEAPCPFSGCEQRLQAGTSLPGRCCVRFNQYGAQMDASSDVVLYSNFRSAHERNKVQDYSARKEALARAWQELEKEAPDNGDELSDMRFVGSGRDMTMMTSVVLADFDRVEGDSEEEGRSD